MKNARLTNGGKPDRGPDGRFLFGCKPGPGNPYAGKVAKLREAGWQAVKPGEVKAVYRKLLALALGGDVPAAKLLFDRLLGAPVPLDYEERLAALEQTMKGSRV